MKNKVTHFMRFSVQDWRTSRVRSRSVTTADPLLRLFYLEALIAMYEHGGTLPCDSEALSDIVMLRVEDVERCLPVLLDLGKRGRGGFIRVGDDRITNQRVVDDLQEDREYRENAAKVGRKGGFSAGRGRPKETGAPQFKLGVPQTETGAPQISQGVPLGSDRGTHSLPLPPPLPVETTETPGGVSRPEPATPKKLTESQQRIRDVEVIFEACGLDAPDPGRVARWITLIGHPPLMALLTELAPELISKTSPVDWLTKIVNERSRGGSKPGPRAVEPTLDPERRAVYERIEREGDEEWTAAQAAAGANG